MAFKLHSLTAQIASKDRNVFAKMCVVCVHTAFVPKHESVKRT